MAERRHFNDATIRLLNRLGAEVVVPDGQGCCGALTHHMGKADDSHKSAAKNIRAWMAEKNRGGLDAIVINTSGCGTTVKDYGHMFRTDPALAEDAKTVATLAKDVSEAMWASGESADAIIEQKGLRQITDTGAIEKAIDEVMEKNPGQLADYRSGKDKLFGFFVGQVMKATGGKANPAQLNDLLKKKLAG